MTMAPEISGNSPGEAIEIPQSLLKNPVYDGIIHTDVIMDNHISKASHINQTRKKIGGKDPLLGQHAEHIRIILRIPKSLPGD